MAAVEHEKDLLCFRSSADHRFAHHCLGIEAGGGAEQNSMVRALMSVGPYKGLILSKLIVLSLALGFALSKKQAAIRSANVVFAAIVAWNLTVIVSLLS